MGERTVSIDGEVKTLYPISFDGPTISAIIPLQDRAKIPLMEGGDLILLFDSSPDDISMIQRVKTAKITPR